ncbi:MULTISPECIES: hypothetical protein [Lysobacteraceae]|jgi:hypothetical protein|uniref:hypothetical protein n=1 Tax=Lysobacteraceae TaxID=32033 RepID=UPI0002F5F82A|nr:MULTISPECIES: hypothetical protein [Xanthomonadaceae]MEB2121959.1 hypothetical protein [Xanthomonas campestris pv. campestris]MBN5154085.1 hypothetical protein [Stenotrophomonas maltophilia]MBO9757947.1 hypothetical protein [Xanthomonas phaseoli pv. manihotis]MBO9765659.1 hypothetical protein [Xanthomonas phaseoli pv. manihotis]MCU1173435.1 hypothetical protein [Stenotrophomonas maltophilia]
MDSATRRAAAKAADKLLKAAGYDTRGKNLRKTMKKKRKAAHVARQGKKTGKMRGALARKSMA